MNEAIHSGNETCRERSSDFNIEESETHEPSDLRNFEFAESTSNGPATFEGIINGNDDPIPTGVEQHSTGLESTDTNNDASRVLGTSLGDKYMNMEGFVPIHDRMDPSASFLNGNVEPVTHRPESDEDSKCASSETSEHSSVLTDLG